MSLDSLVALFQAVQLDAKAHMTLIYCASTLTTFSLAFVKAFQSRNIVLGHYRAAFVTSWGVSTLEVTSVGLVVLGGWWIILSSGIGGSIGTLVAMHTHERFFRKVKP
ncbi:hypothetical protein D3C87_1106340 [compost metagenome]